MVARLRTAKLSRFDGAITWTLFLAITITIKPTSQREAARPSPDAATVEERKMFTALTVSVALAIMLASLLPFTVALEKGWRLAIYMFGAASLLAALFVVAAGVQMLGTYDVALNEPLDTEDAKRVAERGPRAGIAVALVLFWPLVLIGLGGWVAYQSGASLIQEIRITRRGTK